MTAIEIAARAFIADAAAQHLQRDDDLLTTRCAAHLREHFPELTHETANEHAAFAVCAWRDQR